MKALIDLGTNTFNLMIANVDATGLIHVIHSEKDGVALGMGGIHENRLTEDAIDRAVACLLRFKIQCDLHGVSTIRAIGTSAIRDAHNRAELIDRVARETGIHIEVITGLEEAQLIYRGVHQTMDFEEAGVIMDIGGGSVEFILFEGTKIRFKVSLELGGLRLLSLFQQDGQFHLAKLVDMQAYILDQMKPLFTACAEYKPSVLIGAAGAFETIWDLANADMPTRVIPPASKLVITQFYQQKKIVEETDFVGRQTIKGMKAFRAGILPYANVLIATVLKELAIENMWVSSYSLKEGYWFLQNK
jgi:exopolyphosphatase/guanosine-5'-triphosphate,3'-diphosphate pyrophosphatase